MFVHPFPNAFGLNIDDLSLKVVQLVRTGRSHGHKSYALMAARSTTIPHGLIVDGNPVQPENIRNYLVHLLQGSKKIRPITSPWVCASLPDTQGFIKLITIDKPPADVIQDDVLFIIQKHLPFDAKDSYLDWQIIPQKGQDKETSVLVSAVPQHVVNTYTYLLESIGCTVISLELEALATVRAMITAHKTYETEARAILDIGSTRTTLIIYDHDMIQFSTSLSFSGELITTAISQRMHLAYEEAEKYKKEHGLDARGGQLWPVFSKFIDELSDQIQKAFTFYYSHFSHANKVTHITMCGGGARLKHLDRLLSLKVKVKAEPGHIWKNLYSKKTISLDDVEGLSYATAIGLALRATNNPFTIDSSN